MAAAVGSSSSRGGCCRVWCDVCSAIVVGGSLVAGVLPDVVVLVRVLSRCRSRSLWAVRLQRAVGVCVCCVLFVVRQELLVVVLVLCICRKLARSCVYACHGARCAARFGMRHLGMLGQARDGARGVQAGHVRLQSRAQRASPSTTVRHGAQQKALPCDDDSVQDLSEGSLHVCAFGCFCEQPAGQAASLQARRAYRSGRPQ